MSAENKQKIIEEVIDFLNREYQTACKRAEIFERRWEDYAASYFRGKAEGFKVVLLYLEGRLSSKVK